MKDDVVISVENVSKTFKLPHEKQNSIKGLFLDSFKGKRTYEKQKVLKDVSFEVKKGDFFAIVGRNGGGKSTMLKLLAGIYSSDKGAIHVRGKLIPFIELGVGFNPELTGRENVFLNGALLGFNRKEMLAMYDEIVEFAELEKFMDQKLKNYSSGMQVRLAFSIAIRAKGDILLLDEVLAVGDAAFQQKCFDYFRELKQNKKTVVFVSHDMAAVQRFCNKAIYIRKGELIQAGSPSDISDIYVQDNIENTFDGKKVVSHAANDYKLKPKVKHASDNEVVIEFSYEAPANENLYLALSVIKDGVSVAEVNSITTLKLQGSGKARYSFETRHLNAGVYEVSSVLCRREDGHLLCIGSPKLTFHVGDQNSSRGGALKMPFSWENLTKS